MEKIVPLEITQPGLFTNGTMSQRKGRWANGNLVRFDGGFPKPMGGWSALTFKDPDTQLSVGIPESAQEFNNNVYAAHIWHDEAAEVVVAAKTDKLFTFKRSTIGGGAPFELRDITPAGFGSQTNIQQVTFSITTFNGSAYISRAGQAASFIFKYTLGDTIAAQVSGSPGARGVFVTAEQFLMAIGFNNDVVWASQGTDDIWTPTSTNSAGGLTLSSASRLMTGRRVRGQSLVWSEDDVWALDFVGAPLYYGATLVGSGCGIIGPNAVAVVRDTAYWMGLGGFFKYDGYVQQLHCDVLDSVFNPTLARFHGARFFAVVNSPANEIWWFYCVNASAPPNRVVIYNYANETWSLGSIIRTAGTDALWHDSSTEETVSPILFDDTGDIAYQHETASPATGAFIETGPFSLDAGLENTVLIHKVFPDGPGGSDTYNLITGNDPERDSVTSATLGPLGTSPIDVRIRAKYVRWNQNLNSNVSRVGTPRLGIVPSSRR